MRMRFSKKIVICSHDLPFCVAIKCGGQKTKSPRKYYAEKRDLKQEKIRSLNDAWKDDLKTWDQ